MSQPPPHSKERLGQEHAKWKQQSCEIRDLLGVSRDFAPWTSRNTFLGEGINMTDRIRDLLDVTAAKILLKKHGNPKHELSRVFLDVSQSHIRHCHSSDDGLGPCFTTASELYHFGQDRVVLPQEILAMLGYTQVVQLPESVRPRDLKRMLGGGVSLPCVGSVLLSLHIMRTTLPSSPDSVDASAHMEHGLYGAQ